MRVSKESDDFEKRIQKDWEKAGVNVPKEGSESKAASEFRKSARKAGAKFSQAESRKIARAARKNAK